MTSALGELFVDILPSLSEAMPAMAAGGGQAADVFAKAFTEASKDRLGDSFKDLPREQSNAFKGFGGEAAKTFMGGFTDLVKGQMPDLMAPFDLFEDGVKSVFDNIIDSTVGKIPLLGKGISSTFKDALNDLTGPLDSFKAAGGEWISMMSEIGDSYLEMSRKLAATTTDPNQITGLLGDVRDILASGAIVNADTLAESLGRVSSNLKQVDNTQLKEVATTLSEAKELIGRFDDTKALGVINAFNISGDQANGVLTQMVNISRATGASIDQISQAATVAGPAFRQLGLDVTQSTSLIGQLVQTGEPAVRIAQAFNKAVGDFNKQGIDPAAGFREVVSSIQALSAAGNQQGALGMVEQFFGQRSPQVLEEINKGLITIGANGQVAVRGIDGINQPLGTVLEQTMTIGEAFERVGHQIQAAFAPTGTIIARSLVEGGNAISGWVADNQAKLINWGVKITEVFLHTFGDMSRVVGAAMTDSAVWVNLFKDVFIGVIEAIDMSLQSVFGALSILPSWLGGDAFGAAAQTLKDATGPMNAILSTNLTDPMREAGAAATNFADVTLPHLGAQIALTGEQMAAQATLTRAFTESVNGTSTEAFKGVPGGQGADALTLLGSPAQQADVIAKLHDMNVEITTTATGLVTGINFADQKAKDTWDEFWKDRNSHPAQANIALNPVDQASGETLSSTADLLKTGTATININGVLTPTGGAFPAAIPPPGTVASATGTTMPGAPPPSSMPSGTNTLTQDQVASAIIQEGQRRGLPRDQIVAALNVAKLESNYGANPASRVPQNQSGTIVQGTFQQDLGYTGDHNDPTNAASQFFDRLAARAQSGDSAGQAAVRVQQGTYGADYVDSQNQGPTYDRLVNGVPPGTPGAVPGAAWMPPMPGAPTAPAAPVVQTAGTPAPAPVTAWKKAGDWSYLTSLGGQTYWVPPKVTPPAIPADGNLVDSTAGSWRPVTAVDGSSVWVYSAAGTPEASVAPGTPPATPTTPPAAKPPPPPKPPPVTPVPPWAVHMPGFTGSLSPGDVAGIHGLSASMVGRELGTGEHPTPDHVTAAAAAPGAFPPGPPMKPDGSLDVDKLRTMFPGVPADMYAPSQPSKDRLGLPATATAAPSSGLPNWIPGPVQTAAVTVGGWLTSLGNMAGFTAGGSVSGGIPGMDSVLAALEPGEHVFPTDEVQLAGGHGGIYNLRAAIRAGTLKGMQGGGAPGATDNSTTGSPQFGGMPNQPSGQGEDIVDWLKSVVAAFNAAAGTHLTVTADYPGGPVGHQPDSGDHGVYRAIDIGAPGNDQGQMDEFAHWWVSNPDLMQATRQLIHNDPTGGFASAMNVIGGHFTEGSQTYADSPWGGHIDHIHLAVQDIPFGGGSVSTPAFPSALDASGTSTSSGGGGSPGTPGTIGPGGPIMPGYNPWTNLPPGMVAGSTAHQTYTSEYERRQKQMGDNATAVTTATSDYNTEATKNAQLRTQVDQLNQKWQAEAPKIAADLQASNPDFIELQKVNDKLEASNKTLERLQNTMKDAQQTQKINTDAPPPKAPGSDKVTPDRNAEQLGSGLVKGILQEFGLDGSVFGNKPLNQWGIVKLLTGGLNFGAGLLQAKADQADGTTPSQGGQTSGTAGLMDGIFPALKNLTPAAPDAPGTPGAPPVNVTAVPPPGSPFMSPFNGALGSPPGPQPIPEPTSSGQGYPMANPPRFDFGAAPSSPSSMASAMAPGQAPASGGPVGGVGGSAGAGLTYNQFNQGVMSPPEIRDTVRPLVTSTAAPQLSGGGGLP